jgi:hypothetical protein
VLQSRTRFAGAPKLYLKKISDPAQKKMMLFQYIIGSGSLKMIRFQYTGNIWSGSIQTDAV